MISKSLINQPVHQLPAKSLGHPVKRKFSLALIICFAALTLTACDRPPATVIVVVSATPDANVVKVTVTPQGRVGNPTVVVPTAASLAVTPTQAVPNSPIAATTTIPTNTPVPPTAIPTTPISPVAPATATVAPPVATVPTITLPATVAPATQPIAATLTVNPRPTDVRGELYIAQQDFEGGYMFWISSQRTIWVLFKDSGNPNQGEWQSYPDAFVDGQDPETLPSIVPPRADTFQPRRGFGKLWRETPGLREQLGWATTPEFALTTVYVYIAGGTVQNGTFTPAPGRHQLTSLSRQTFTLAEPPVGQVRGRWERVG